MRSETDIGGVLWHAADEGLRVRVFGTAGMLVSGEVTRMNDNFVEIESGGFFYYVSLDAVKMVAYLPEGARL